MSNAPTPAELDDLAASLADAKVETFNPDEFRRVGAVAQFDPQYCTGKSAPLAGQVVKVVKVNPSTIRVITEDGTPIITDAWMLVPAEREFVEREAERRLMLGNIVRATGVRLTGAAGLDLFVIVGKQGLDGKTKIAPLGGTDRGTVWTVPASGLTYVDPKEVLR